jgi:hypothetical protein
VTGHRTFCPVVARSRSTGRSSPIAAASRPGVLASRVQELTVRAQVPATARHTWRPLSAARRAAGCGWDTRGMDDHGHQAVLCTLPGRSAACSDSATDIGDTTVNGQTFHISRQGPKPPPACRRPSCSSHDRQQARLDHGLGRPRERRTHRRRSRRSTTRTTVTSTTTSPAPIRCRRGSMIWLEVTTPAPRRSEVSIQIAPRRGGLPGPCAGRSTPQRLVNASLPAPCSAHHER